MCSSRVSVDRLSREEDDDEEEVLVVVGVVGVVSLASLRVDWASNNEGDGDCWGVRYAMFLEVNAVNAVQVLWDEGRRKEEANAQPIEWIIMILYIRYKFVGRIVTFA